MNPLVRIGLDIPDLSPAGSSSAIPSKEALESFFSTVDIKTIPKEIEVYSLGDVIESSTPDPILPTLQAMLPIKLSELPPLVEQQAAASSSQSAKVDPVYVSILNGTREALNDSFLDISDAIGDLSERESLLQSAMGPENTFADVSDINVRIALQMINSFWNNSKNAAVNYHGFNLNNSLKPEDVLSNTRKAISELIKEQVTPSVASSSTPAQDTKALTQELYLAACQNRIEDITRLLAMGVDPNAANERGWTPLFAACRGLKVEAVEALLRDPRVNVNIPTLGSGVTPLMTALDMSCQDYFKRSIIIDRLIAKGANVHIKNKNGQDASQVMAARVENMRDMGWSNPQFETQVARYGRELYTLTRTQTAPAPTRPEPSSSTSMRVEDFYMPSIIPMHSPLQPSSSNRNIPMPTPTIVPKATRRAEPPAARTTPRETFFASPQPASEPASDPVFERFLTAVVGIDWADLENMLTQTPELINRTNSMGDTAILITTIAYSDASDAERPVLFNMITYLLSKRADFNRENREGVSALTVALNNELTEVVELMFSNNPTP
jgi:ankyrin repeat protein